MGLGLCGSRSCYNCSAPTYTDSDQHRQVGRPLLKDLHLEPIPTNSCPPARPQNGYLMSTFALVRATFLTFAFPSIIDYGRKWYTHTEVKSTGRAPLKRGVSSYGSTNNIHGGRGNGTRQPPAYDTLSISSDPSTASSSSNDDGSDEDAPHSGYGKDSEHQSGFDLAFLRWSCLVDAVLTSVLTFSGKSWQMYIGECLPPRLMQRNTLSKLTCIVNFSSAGGILPLASAAAPAAKGVIMEMVTPGERPEALSGLALIELMATVICPSVFGSLFALLSEKGKPGWIFAVDGGVAGVAFLVLVWVRLPPSPEEVGDEEEQASVAG